ncbi:porin family protein [Flavobacterium capsici]|uniref:Porin family protein n=1 Tax=Flavobacterium capsici TaxID=3075618 RepID=A0AA96J7I9_9FLAO|nr:MULTISPECIES: porin family protein [unclassified Flavobacterium]WNM18359.1 porin family protein [Flavobacterium sp. PMR2A8]WNM22410.1 porin family protein [Flavobacterium sp. PMTSA4]
MKTVTSRIGLVIVLFLTTICYSQETKIDNDDRDQMRFGFKAGVNFSNVYDEEGNNFVADGKTGLAAGVFLSVPFGKVIGFQPELIYSQKGFKATGSVLGFDYDYKRTTTYLDIPLLLQIKPSSNFTLLAGPQFSYLLETKNEFNNTSNTVEEEINGDNYKKNIFGFVVGADVNLDQFVIGGRLGWDISKSDSDGNSDSPRYKNQVIQLTLGYRF